MNLLLLISMVLHKNERQLIYIQCKNILITSLKINRYNNIYTLSVCIINTRDIKYWKKKTM